MKKSFTLLITLILLISFSFLTIFIMETKALKSENLSNQYLYIQAKNHMMFFKDYIKNEDLKDVTHLQIEDELYDIYATLDRTQRIFHLYVKAKNYNITLYEKVIKE